MKEVKSIVIHHSASRRDTTWIKQIDEWHRARGFAGCGYHYVIEGDGKVREGRRLPKTGAHAPPNSGRIGICITGDNTKPGERWSGEQIISARLLVASLQIVWTGLRVEGHRDLMAPGHTECPGIDVGQLFK